jgi:hypothetical protein
LSVEGVRRLRARVDGAELARATRVGKVGG